MLASPPLNKWQVTVISTSQQHQNIQLHISLYDLKDTTGFILEYLLCFYIKNYYPCKL